MPAHSFAMHSFRGAIALPKLLGLPHIRLSFREKPQAENHERMLLAAALIN